MKRDQNISSYRWVVLLAIMPMIISTEMMWLSLAPISSLAEKFYNTDSMSIAVFSMSYMIMFILFSLPASWVIDRFGFKTSLIIGALLTSVFGITRAVFSDSFTAVLVSQFLIAIGQPFLLNISTKVPANWFPINERSTAAGLLTMAQYMGFAVAMVLSPALVEADGIPLMLSVFAAVAVVSSIVCIVFTKERPPVPPPGPVASTDAMQLSNLKQLISNRPYRLVLLICFVSMGIFNAILTLIEPILLPRGITTIQAGTIGAIFVVAGIAGAVILPLVSDHLKVRVPLFIGVVSVLVPLFAGLTFFTGFGVLCAVSAITGFLIMGVAPILFQYGSEVAYPVQEGTSLGLILLMGQISGMLFVYLFEMVSNSTGSIILPMLLIVIATALQIPFTFKMKESETLL